MNAGVIVWRHILIGTGPLLVNSASGFLLGLLAWQGKWAGEEQYLLAWLGLSVGAHSFPSSGDARVDLAGESRPKKNC